ncbi:tRNA pseudouridine(38-40) synthase TruA [Tissierella creatinini]|nr:tRNA pseudouridine(38-40) synthase TruA [Tissierella creatinini]TJX66025.1 tRNA pseudouridine(38-40) synthase TruA [Soehngenia saccharolytica]
MKNIKLIIEYDGTNYSGWQNQENAVTLQEVIEKSIGQITGEIVRLIGSGRTDGGVHALGQVANFLTNSTIPGEKFKKVLNNVLPEDIAIIDSMEVDMDFHSRFSATRKRYRYVIYNGNMPSPIHRYYSLHYKYDLDIDRMKQGAQYLIGEHDFESFMNKGSIVKDTIRTIYEINIYRQGNFIEITIEGNSFLKYMVRNIVGTLIVIGNKRKEPQDILNILRAKNREAACKTAPPCGLFLEKVYYE